MGEGKKVARKEEGTKEIRSHHSHISADSLFIEGRTAVADISVAGSSRSSSVFIVPSFRSLSARVSRQIPNRQRRNDRMDEMKRRKASDLG